MLEAMKEYSVGRGTDMPLEQIGATWIDGAKLSAYMNERAIPGVHAFPMTMEPSSSIAAGTRIGGIRFAVLDRDHFNAVSFGIELASALRHLYPTKVDFEGSKNLIGNRAAIDALKKGEDPKAINVRIQLQLEPFLERRSKFLLY